MCYDALNQQPGPQIHVVHPLGPSLERQWPSPDSCPPEAIVSETCTPICRVRYRGTVASRRVHSKKDKRRVAWLSCRWFFVNRVSLMEVFLVSLPSFRYACSGQNLNSRRHDIPKNHCKGRLKALGQKGLI